jgi:putative glutamine amidotransferase
MQHGHTRGHRPLIAIPARFTDRATALRFRGEVLPRTLLEAVFNAGGEPLVVHPYAPDGAASQADVAERLMFADGVVLPGGGDLSPTWTASSWHETHYGVDVEQDGFDLAVARWAVEAGIPLLAICRGLQVLNVALGGTLHADMNDPPLGRSDHVGRVHPVSVAPGSGLSSVVGLEATVSCYHHQCVNAIAPRLRATAIGPDGTIEALEPVFGDVDAWTLAVQWHPEDTADVDPTQLHIFTSFIGAARGGRLRARPGPAVKVDHDPERGPICQ